MFHLAIVTHVLGIISLEYCSVLCLASFLQSFQKLKLIQIGPNCQYHIVCSLQDIYWLPACFKIQFNPTMELSPQNDWFGRYPVALVTLTVTPARVGVNSAILVSQKGKTKARIYL